MTTSPKFSPEVREWAVRLVHEHQGEHDSPWAAIVSIASQMGSVRPKPWAAGYARSNATAVSAEGLTSCERERLKVLERENLERHQANAILRQISAYVAQAELDRSLKR